MSIHVETPQNQETSLENADRVLREAGLKTVSQILREKSDEMNARRPTMTASTLPPGTSASEFLEQHNAQSQRVAKMFRDAGAPMMIEGALAALTNGTSADDLGQLAVALSYRKTDGVNFCPIFRGEYQQVKELMSCDEVEYVQLRCAEEGVSYFEPPVEVNDGVDPHMAYRQEYREVTQGSRHSGGVQMACTENEYVNVRLVEDGKPAVDFGSEG